MRIELYIQGIKVKLFDKDETIKINRKVKDYRDIENIFSDYSESFTVPGEANNNIFKHYYDADIEGGFDARIKQPAKIFIDQELFKEGVIQLKQVQVKNKKIDNYKVQFFTQLTQLIETFGEDELNDLDMSQYTHLFNTANVKQGLTSGLFTNEIIYPLLSYDRRFIYDDDQSNTLDNTDIVNIAANSSGGTNSVDFRELKPAIKVNSIFERIKDFYSLNFIGSIFDNADFTELYMNLVNKEQESQSLTAVTAFSQVVDSNSGSATNEYLFTSLNTTVVPNAGFEFTPFKIKHVVTQGGQSSSVSTGLITGDGSAPNPQLVTDHSTILPHLVEVVIESGEPFEYTGSTSADVFFSTTGGETVYTNESLTSIPIVPELQVGLQFQEFKIKDFVKAFVKAFNLIVIPINDDTILFEPLEDWYRNGKIIDITPYVDNQDLEVKPGELISGVKFEYEKNETLFSSQFKENNNRGFGNLEEDFFDQNGEKLAGKQINVKLPFEKPIFEKIADNCQYGFLVDEDAEEFLPFHSIFYVKKLSGSPISLKDNEQNLETIQSYLSPVTSQNPLGSLATNFKKEFDEFTLDESIITFYTKYYKGYIEDVFDIKRRNYNMKAMLPLRLIKNINLNDRLIIGQRRYIINSYKADIITKKVELDLFNDIFTSGLNPDSDSTFEQGKVILGSENTTISNKVKTNSTITSVSTDNNRFSPKITNNTITITTENTSGSILIDKITATLANGETPSFFIAQKG